MDPATLEFLKWLLVGATVTLLWGAASTLFFLQLFTGQPLDFLGQVFGAGKREMKRLRAENQFLRQGSGADKRENQKLRAENQKLHRLLDGVQTEVKALPTSTQNDALRDRIETLEAMATGDHQPKVDT